MTDERFWQDKLAALFHDPFVKAWCQGQTAKAIAREFWRDELNIGPDEDVPEVFWDRWAQEKIGALLSKHLLGDAFVLPDKWRLRNTTEKLRHELAADWLPAAIATDLAAAGADRPVLGDRYQVRVQFWEPGKAPTVTHPLDPSPLALPAPADLAELIDRLRPAVTLLDGYRRPVGDGPDRFRRAFYVAWRRLPEDLARQDGVFWPLQPAETRCPDHSIADHLRVTSALAFMPQGETADDRVRGDNQKKRPWFLSLWVGPARAFLGPARSGRDLWTGSMILSELAWALIEPVVTELGADAVLYPDLRTNPRADLWLKEAVPDLLRPDDVNGSRAALIPNRLIALVPEGDLDAIAERCLTSARKRWEEMAQYVRAHLQQKFGAGPWQAIFDRQLVEPPALRWSATQWVRDRKPTVVPKRQEIRLDPAIPFQDDPQRLPEPIRDIEAARAQRFDGWLDQRTWTHYQALRQTALMTHPDYLLNQRGFDYALAHHQLLVLDAARAGLGETAGEPEPGEKCTLCGCRQALSNRPEGNVGAQRAAARELWQKINPADTEDDGGAERLCGPCAVRRYLSDTGDPIKAIWAGTLSSSEQESGGSHAVPFPSTGLIAGQDWLDQVCKKYIDGDPAVRAAVGEVVRAFDRSDAKRQTQFAWSLPRLRRRLQAPGMDGRLKQFLKYDIQTLDPDWWTGRSEVPEQPPEWKACRRLRQAMEGSPETGIALVALDGDRIGQLLLGDPDRVKARWRDVLHPDAVDQICEGDATADQDAWKRFWRTSLDDARVLGPSTHAFITRALRHFSNRVLPWVVEREYGGRLIYAGGDDALFLCPAADALPLLRRLNELFTAAWVLDIRPEATAWPAAEPPDALYDVGSTAAKDRFSLPQASLDGVNGRIFPMLGRHQSFSAGVAYGHFKTSLRLLRARALDNRSRAKAAGGRCAGLTWFTRSGPKVHWLAPLACGSAGGIGMIADLAREFGRKSLPGRLPYKLRELLPIARAIMRADDLSEDRRRDLLERLVRRALDGEHDKTKEVVATWRAGLERWRQTADPGASRTDQWPDTDGEASLGGLLFARALAGAGRGPDDREPDDRGGAA